MRLWYRCFFTLSKHVQMLDNILDLDKKKILSHLCYLGGNIHKTLPYRHTPIKVSIQKLQRQYSKERKKCRNPYQVHGGAL